jgi:cell division protein DivIC
MKKAFRIFTNKFLLTALAFLVWMIYFDQNDWLLQQQRKKELQAIKDDIVYLKADINKMENEQAELAKNPKRLEQYARENFRMKKDNEDLYLIENK